MVSGISSFSTASLSEMRQQMFTRIDSSGNGSIDRNEFAALAQQQGADLVDELFGSLDTDQDSLISQMEFDSALAKLERQMKKDGPDMQAMSGMPPQPGRVFDSADTNQDGSVSEDELTTLMGENASEVFAEIDTDGDGLISRAEDEAFRDKMHEQMSKGGSGMSALSGMSPPPPPPDRVFDTADTDGDGSVSKDELMALMGDKASEVFAEVDSDSDGLISRAEDEAFREKMDEQMKQNVPPEFGTGGFGQDWHRKLFDALLSGLAGTTDESTQSSSLYA